MAAADCCGMVTQSKTGKRGEPRTAQEIAMIKRKQIGLDEAAGKTIEGVAGLFQGRIILYTDGTFSHFEAADEYGSKRILERRYYDTNSDVSVDELIKIGFWTQEECDQLYAEKQAKWQEDRERADRYNYEKLKAKFGG
jgi:hypothetical protein